MNEKKDKYDNMKRKTNFNRVLAAVLTIAAIAAGQQAWAQSLSGSGTQTNPYVINSVDDWNIFANSSNASTYWSSGKYVRLGADIGPVTTMVGTSTSSCFQGTFDGFGHTLTVNLTHTGGGDAFAAPFKYLNGACIKRLHIAGTITTDGKMSAGIVGDINGSVTIQNCRSSVTISTSVNGDGTHGGFAGRVESGKTLTITNCLFDGVMTGSSTNSCGGFVGWKAGSLTLDHCLQAGDLTGIGSTGGATFHRASSNFASFTTCYYKTAYGTAQGTQTSVTGSDLQALLGDGWEVNENIVVPVMNASNLSFATISGLQDYCFYFDSPINIGTYTVRDYDNNLLTEGTHYTTELKNSSNEIIYKTDNAYLVSGVDTYTLTVTAIDGGGYKGSKTFTFTTFAPQFEGVTTWTELKTKMSEGGYIRLDADITDPSPSNTSFLSVPSGKSVVLDLNSHTIDHKLTEATSNGYVIKIGTSYESSASASSLTVIDSGSGGKITGGWNSGNGGGVYINTNATLILNKGDISGNISTSTNYGGGGVFLFASNSTFTMNGGSVADNTAKNGGGISIYDGTFNMTGGTISGNTANGESSNGGGIYRNGGSINMSGGNITGNKAELGGGIKFEGHALTVSGLVNISGNTKNDGTTPNNVYIKNESLLSHLVIGSDMDANARIGITSATAPGSGIQIELTSGLSSRSESFLQSDNDAYMIYHNDNGEAVLGVATYYSITPATCENGTVEVSPASARSGQAVIVTLMPQTDYAVQSVYYTPNNGTERTYIPNDNGEYRFLMPAMNVTVCAEFKYWNTVNYTITYVNSKDGENGVTNNNPTSYTPSDAITLSEPTRTYYTFVGWTYQGQTEPVKNVTIDAGSTGDKIFTAVWAPDLATYWGADANHDGTSDEHAYLISSTTGLDLLAQWVNSGDFDSNGKYFKLTTNLTYTHGSGENEMNYTPIGGSYPFLGHFNGNGKTISGIRMTLPSMESENLGVFAHMKGSVSNVILDDAVFAGSGSIGGIVARNNGTVQNCTVLNTVTIRVVDSDRGRNFIGGIVGYNNNTTVSGCTSSVSISATTPNDNDTGWGGIVGYNSGYNSLVSGCFANHVTISDCNQAGSIVGYIAATSTDNYTHNYYHACTVGANTTDIGFGASYGNPSIGDISGWSEPVYAVATGTGIAAATATVTNGGIGYYTNGTDVTLSHGDRDGYTFSGYASSDVTISEGVFTMPASDVTVNATWRKLLTNTDITIADIPTQTYTGSALTPVVTVTDETTTLTGNSDYTITLADGRINAGNYTITITGINGYDGSVEKTFTISPAPLTITTGSDTKEYDGTPLTSNVTSIEGLVNSETASIDATGSQTAVGASQNTYGITWDGTAVSTNYSIATENLGTLTVTSKVTAYGALTITETESGKTATIDGSSLEAINITDNITVNTVTYDRTFTADKASTVMLPFDYTCNSTEGGTFYRFVGVEQEGYTLVATMQTTGDGANNAGTLIANTPYLFMPTGTGITFGNIPIGGVTLCTTGGGGGQTADQGSNWTFKGTYRYMKWTTDTNDQDYNAERAAEIGSVYGFAGVQKEGIEVGDFVKVASGARIRPMSAYLIWSNTANLAPARTGRNAAAATAGELPQSITVRLLDASGTVTNVGEIDTVTGEVSFDGWYTLQGVKLEAEPTEPGIYINNGKTVSIQK